MILSQVHTKSSVISSLKEEEGSVATSQSDILRISKSLNAGLHDVKSKHSTSSQSVLSSITEVLDDSMHNAAQDNKKTRNILRHLQMAVHNDEELTKLLGGVAITQGWVLPNI
ncbi:histone H2A-like [Heterodontus francisci]|uniref:histone H2A-like n=1 Tax=Heterodontus francisci TaxID=7792 RepID=UPI00355BDA58